MQNTKLKWNKKTDAMNTEIILGLLEEENGESEESEEEDVIKSKEKVNEKEEGDTEETKKKRVNKTPESSKEELQEEEVQVEAEVPKEAGVQEGSDMDEDESELEDGEVPCEIQDMNNSTNDEGSDEEAPAKKKQNTGNKAQHDFDRFWIFANVPTSTPPPCFKETRPCFCSEDIFRGLCMPGGGQQPGVRLPGLHPRHHRRDRMAGAGGTAEQADAGFLADERLGGQ